MALPDGLYDLVLTEGLAKALASLDPSKADVAALNGGATEHLTNVIARQLSAILNDVSGEDGGPSPETYMTVYLSLYTRKCIPPC